MKTLHLYQDNRMDSAQLSQMVKEKIKTSFYRVVECGDDLVILPETDKFNECDMPELMRTLGFAKKRSSSVEVSVETVETIAKEPETTEYQIQFQADAPEVWEMNESQVRLLEVLADYGFLPTDLTIVPFKDVIHKKI